MNKAVFLNRKETIDQIHAPKIFFKLKAQFMAQVFAKSANANLDSSQSILRQIRDQGIGQRTHY